MANLEQLYQVDPKVAVWVVPIVAMFLLVTSRMVVSRFARILGQIFGR